MCRPEANTHLVRGMSYCKVIDKPDWYLIELLENGFPDDCSRKAINSNLDQLLKQYGDEQAIWYGRYTEDHRLIGCLAIYHEPRLGHNLFAFTINEIDRKQGHGKALLNYILGLYPTVYIYSEFALVPYYETLGFKQEVCLPLGQPKTGTVWMFRRPEIKLIT